MGLEDKTLMGTFYKNINVKGTFHVGIKEMGIFTCVKENHTLADLLAVKNVNFFFFFGKKTRTKY